VTEFTGISRGLVGLSLLTPTAEWPSVDLLEFIHNFDFSFPRTHTLYRGGGDTLARGVPEGL